MATERSNPRGWTVKRAASLPASRPLEVVQWVARHLDVKDVKPSDAPAPEYWSLLEIVRTNTAQKWEFWRTMWSRQIPSQAQIEAAARFEDDGRENEKLIEELQEGFATQSIQLDGPEGPPEQS